MFGDHCSGCCTCAHNQEDTKEIDTAITDMIAVLYKAVDGLGYELAHDMNYIPSKELAVGTINFRLSKK